MQTCYNCGKEVSDQTLICPDCGALVKRYTEAPRHSAFADQPAPAPEPVQPQERPKCKAVARYDEKGKPVFKGGFVFWMVLCALASGYMALSFGCMLILHQNFAMYETFLLSLPEFEPILEMFYLITDMVASYPLYFWLLFLLSAAHAGSVIWFMVARTRLPLSVYSATGGALGVLMLIVTSAGYGIICMLGTLFTALQLRGVGLKK